MLQRCKTACYEILKKKIHLQNFILLNFMLIKFYPDFCYYSRIFYYFQCALTFFIIILKQQINNFTYNERVTPYFKLLYQQQEIIIILEKMSHGYGFLTQSTIVPKKSKQIKINDNSGQVLMQSILQKQMDKLKSGKKPQITSKPKEQKKNPGIQQRMKKDEQAAQKNKLVQKNYYKCLERKAQVYDKVNNKKTNVQKLLVDFESKETQQSKKQAQQYQKQRQAFYKGQINNIQTQQKSLHQNAEAEKTSTNQLRERLAWEKDMLNEMKGQDMEISQKPKVFQSFDNKLSKQQKQAFQKVMNEQEQQKIKLDAIKRRKQMMETQRIRKLKKLNIISDVGQASKHEKQIKQQTQNAEDKNNGDALQK